MTGPGTGDLKLSGFRDAFDVLSTQWVVTAGRPYASDGRLVMPPSFFDLPYPDQLTRLDGEAWSLVSFDARGQSLALEWQPVGVGSQTTFVGIFPGASPRTDALLWRYAFDPASTYGWVLEALLVAGGIRTTVATLPSNAQQHRFVRIRENGGRAYWETSPDGFTWTEAARAAHGLTLTTVRVTLGATYWAPGDTPSPVTFDNLNVYPWEGDVVTLTGSPGEPFLAVDVQPDNVTGVFQLDVSQVDGPDRLAWSNDDPGAWVNVVCDVMRVNYHRGATRTQGVLTQTEAGTGTLLISDTRRAFDPVANADAIHKGTPLRLRAWGYAPVTEQVEVRRNLASDPRAVVGQGLGARQLGWMTSRGFGTGGAGTYTLITGAVDGPLGISTYLRKQWTTAATAVASSGFLHASIGAYPVTPGAVYTVSSYLRCNRTAVHKAQVGFQWYDAAGAAIGAPVYPAAAVTLPGATAWTRISATAQAPANAAYLAPLSDVTSTISSTPWSVGNRLEGTALLVEKAPALGAYFDGATAPGVDGLTHEWLGTADRSPALELVPQTSTQRWDAVLFSGEVGDLEVAYLRDEVPQVTVTFADAVAIFAGWSSPGRTLPGIGQGDNLLARTQRVVDEVRRSVVSADSDATGYAATLNPATLAQPWADLNAATEAELGRLWVDRHNRLVVRTRGSRLTGPVRGTLSDVHGEAPLGVHCCVADAAVVYGAESMANRVVAGRTHPQVPGQTDASVVTVVRRDDEWSQARYGVGTVDRQSLALETDAQLAPWAEAVITAHTYPELRVDSVAPLPSPDDLDSALPAWKAALQTDLGDRWLFRYHPAVGPVVDRAVGVLGITLEASPDGWSLRWTTEDAPAPGRENPTGWFVLGLSQLDGPDVLAPYSSPSRL